MDQRGSLSVKALESDITLPAVAFGRTARAVEKRHSHEAVSWSNGSHYVLHSPVQLVSQVET